MNYNSARGNRNFTTPRGGRILTRAKGERAPTFPPCLKVTWFESHSGLIRPVPHTSSGIDTNAPFCYLTRLVRIGRVIICCVLQNGAVLASNVEAPADLVYGQADMRNSDHSGDRWV